MQCLLTYSHQTLLNILEAHTATKWINRFDRRDCIVTPTASTHRESQLVEDEWRFRLKFSAKILHCWYSFMFCRLSMMLRAFVSGGGGESYRGLSNGETINDKNRPFAITRDLEKAKNRKTKEKWYQNVKNRINKMANGFHNDKSPYPRPLAGEPIPPGMPWFRCDIPGIMAKKNTFIRRTHTESNKQINWWTVMFNGICLRSYNILHWLD